jgi:ubiquinone/menaquinone biosynthesis C-methylase UbiE
MITILEVWCIFDTMDLFERKGDQYGRIARFYDVLLEPAIRPLRLEICRLISENNHGPVLDLCCGTGRQLIMLGQIGVTGVGVDFSSAMLNVARRKNNGMARFIRGDVARLPFNDHQFQQAMISLALHENPEPIRRAILAEAMRVLVPGGWFFIVDYERLGPLRRTFGNLLTDRVEWLAGKNHYYYYKEFIKRGGVEGLCGRGGLAVERVNDFFSGNVGLFVVKND